MIEHLVSADVIAEHLGLTEHSIYTCLARRRMPAHRLGLLWKFKVIEVDEWVCNGRADQMSELSKKDAH